ncbi:MAG TPA: SMP-30/gluconolactonase/LRE family protein [Planctomycetota bacterium]|nr:SMP-30/gluconolactonase/LRE family protein [Planctomycetota bacterium]
MAPEPRGLAFAAALCVAVAAGAQAPAARAAAVEVDLGSTAGARQVGAEWRYHDAELVEVDFREPGPDRKPSGAPNRTHDIAPHAGAEDFDDSGWPVIAPDSLEVRRGTGRLCFGWYRVRFEVPATLGGVATAGRTLEFEVVLDDYAEVWVDGRLPRYLGQNGGSLVAGWNAPNRLLLTHRAFAGQHFTIAIFGANGPLSEPPANYLWIRSATLRLGATEPWGAAQDLAFERLDARLDGVVSPRASVEQVSAGHTWLEGPAWDRQRECLYFSDIPRNEVLRWAPGQGTSTFLAPSGYSGAAPFAGREPGSNGLAVDAGGRLWLCQHGDRRIARREADGTLVGVVEAFEGRRLNSPNDLLLAPNGDLYFTDPPFGLPGQFEDPARELPFAGVYRRTPDGTLVVLERGLRGPNGLALAPDGRTLYVSDADPEAPKWVRVHLDERGRVIGRDVLLDAARWKGQRPGFPDGMKVDAAGNLFACGPGGLYVFGADGSLLGVLHTGVATSNCAFGADARTLFVTAGTALLAVRW